MNFQNRAFSILFLKMGSLLIAAIINKYFKAASVFYKAAKV